MGYTEKELQYLYTKEPELEPMIFSLDRCIQLFLETYEVFVEPTYDYKHYNQTAVNAWIKWKQWALVHEKFESYKKDVLDHIESHNKEIEEKLNNPEYINKFDAWLKLWRSKRDNNIEDYFDNDGFDSHGFEDLFETFFERDKNGAIKEKKYSTRNGKKRKSVTTDFGTFWMDAE